MKLANSIRMCSGCVVYNEGLDQPRILLVTTSDGEGWTFPKGGVEEPLSVEDSAAKEVYEEAGASGIIECPLVAYRYAKYDDQLKAIVVNEVKMFLMRFERFEETWPERGLRKVRWFTVPEALAILDKHLIPVLYDAAQTKTLKKLQRV